MNRLAFIGYKVLFQRGLRIKAFQPLTQYHLQVVIECNKSRVEGGVVKTGEAKSVARIKPLIWKIAPRLNVAGNKQPWNVDTTNSATHSISVYHCLPEELLSTAHASRRGGFCRTHGGGEFGRWFKPHLVTLQKIHFAVVFIGEKVV